MLAGFDAGQDRYQFVRVSRATYRESAFLDHRIQPRPAEVRSLAGAEVDLLLRAVAPRPASWIFHTAFCASTLLAQCLDHEARTLVLREPAVLSRLAASERQQGTGANAVIRRRVLALIARSYGGERVIVKPSNYANALLPAVLSEPPARGPAHRCVLLSCSLRELLISLLNKRREAGRLLASFTAALLADSDYSERTGHPPLDSLTLLQQGVLFWHCQRYHFQSCLERAGRHCTLGLTMARWLERPAQTLAELDGFFELGLDEAAIQATVAAGAFRWHAKTGARYGPQQRDAEAVGVAERHAAEIASALQFARPLLAELPVKPLIAGENLVGA